MKSMVKKSWRIILGLLVIMVLVSCGSSQTGTTKPVATLLPPTPTATPTLAIVPTAVKDTTSNVGIACVLADSFKATVSNGISITVDLGQADCPTGDIGISVAVFEQAVSTYGAPHGDNFVIPQGEVSTEMTLCHPLAIYCNPIMGTAGDLSIVISFTSEKIDKIILMGNGSPVELQRQ